MEADFWGTVLSIFQIQIYYPPIMENQMEKKMENEMETLGPFKGVYRDITPIMENQMEKKMENEMETGEIGI